MRFVVRLLGVEVFAVECGPDLEEPEEEPQWHGHSMTGAHIERDTTPLSPDDRYDWEWEDKGFGFKP